MDVDIHTKITAGGGSSTTMSDDDDKRRTVTKLAYLDDVPLPENQVLFVTLAVCC